MFAQYVQTKKAQKGFTLIEILIVVALIAILAAVVFVALNPAKNFADTRNATRSSDASNLLNSVTLYITSEGKSVSTLETAAGGTIAVCNDGGTSWSDIVDGTPTASSQVNLKAALVDEFIATVPRDPQAAQGNIDTGYDICKTANGRMTIKAPNAENSKVIEVKR